MADKDVKNPDHSDTKEPSDTFSTAKGAKDHTASGQEAARGELPEGHTHEHQSNYGGGGANGGATKA
jgi:hypothetical protein